MFNKENNMYEGYIYQIYNPFNMKSYIGQTTRTINDRISKHKKRAKSHTMDSPVLYQDIRDYGFDKFDVYEIEKVFAKTLCELKMLLNEKEIHYIAYYNSIVPNGYNISKGGQEIGDSQKIYQFDEFGNMICEYESTQDIRLKTNFDTGSIIRSCREHRSMAHGYYWSFSDRLSDDYFNSRRLKRKVVMYDLNGDFVKIFESIKSAAFEITGDKSKWHQIQKCAAKEKYYKTAYGYIWRYCDDVECGLGNVIQSLSKEEIIDATTNNRNRLKGKRICQFSLDGDYLTSYCTVTDASNKTGINRSNIGHCLSDRQGSAGGYIWKYYDDVKDELFEKRQLVA